MVESIGDSLRFMETLAGVQAGGAEPRRLLHQPRGAPPALRAGADPAGAAPRRLVQPVDALALDRHAHRDARRRARRVLPRHPQPDRRQDRTGDDPGVRCASCSRSSIPTDEPGRLTLIHRFGADRIARRAAAAGRGRARRRPDRAVVLRSDARQHRGRRQRRQDPPLRQHPRRARAGLRDPRGRGLVPRRRPLRADRARTSPSASAARAASAEADLERAYASRVDPRLNYEQALEMALLVARTVAKRNGREV